MGCMAPLIDEAAQHMSTFSVCQQQSAVSQSGLLQAAKLNYVTPRLMALPTSNMFI